MNGIFFDKESLQELTVQSCPGFSRTHWSYLQTPGDRLGDIISFRDSFWHNRTMDRNPKKQGDLASYPCLLARVLDEHAGEVEFMFVFWRGRGPVVFLAAILPLASCLGLMDWNPVVAIALAGATAIPGGLACLYFGRKWNQGSGVHMLYWIPVEIWGWILLLTGSLIVLLIAIGLIRKAIAG
jgi:hypothetical protein